MQDIVQGTLPVAGLQVKVVDAEVNVLPGEGLVTAAAMDGGFGVGVAVVDFGAAAESSRADVNGGPVGGQIHGRAGAGGGWD